MLVSLGRDFHVADPLAWALAKGFSIKHRGLAIVEMAELSKHQLTQVYKGTLLLGTLVKHPTDWEFQNRFVDKATFKKLEKFDPGF